MGPMKTLEVKDGQFHGEVGAVLPLDTKALDEDGQFEGYASVFGDKDQGYDIVAAGAFGDSLVKRPAAKVKMLFQHRTDVILGQWLEMREDAKGLYVKGQLFLEDDQAKKVHLWMRKGQLDGLSIGYRTIRHEFDEELGIRRLLELELREVSLVTFPMLESATVSLVKGDTLPTERELEKYLRDGGFSAAQSKAIIASGYKSLRSARDAADGDDTGLLDALRGLRGNLNT